MGKTTLPAFQCDRCTHAWIPRLKTEVEPALCPKCKSAYWNRPRRTDIAKTEIEQAMESLKLKRKKNRRDI